MSRKDFDAKQFLLEKGERIGLGVAVTLMVLMLILSLFMPGKGFFSGSPAAKAKELNKSTGDLDNALATRQPGPNDKPEERGEGKLIALDTQGLNPSSYETAMWFEPRMQENKSRRPPDIYTVEEAVAEVAYVPVDTYMFRWTDPPRICVLVDKDRNTVAGGGGGGMNPFNKLRGGSGMMPTPSGGSRGSGGMAGQMMQNRNRFMGNNNAPGSLFGIGGAADKPDYEAKYISVEEWNPQQLTAHQLQPLRMAIIAGSFPYKKQLEEHKNKLRLDSIDRVLEEPVGEGDKKGSAFDFRGVEVERMEVDADGKTIQDWIKLPLKESFDVWLKNSYYPAEPENPKYAQVRANDGIGLVMPLLREFHASKVTTPGFPGMMSGMGALGGLQRRQETPPDEPKTKYPDVPAKLPKIQETLDNLQKAQPKQIASSRFKKAELGETFNPNVVPPSDDANKTNQPGGTNASDSYVPDYVLVRVVDVTIEPGKHYKYRLKIKMTNPNYQRPDVASPEYKEKETLESKDWYELPQTVTVPPETFYYVVDELQALTPRDLAAIRALAKQSSSAQARMLETRLPHPDQQVAFQFHRWVESTRLSQRDTQPIPVGEWAVAERVFVSRGEYVGQTVNVDLPIWKYTQNAFILPAPERPKKGSRIATTGIDVDFGQEPSENNLILVDFEGGRGLQLPNAKIKDECAIEVLMLSPDGKLLARNSVKDTSDKDRKDRRDEVYKRIQDVREGKGTE